MISVRFESLAQALRVFTEQYDRFFGLLPVDAPEAVGNLDHAVDGILNAYHGLHDAIQNDQEVDFDFYADPICAFVLRFRNARHHNHARGVRSVYRCARTEAPPVDYLLVNFPAGEGDEGGSYADYFISWGDMQEYLNALPERFAESVDGSRLGVGADIFEAWCAEREHPTQRIFINSIPVLFAAGTACINAIVDRIEPESVEAGAFLDLFQTVAPANFRTPEYTELTSGVFWPN